MSRNSNNNLKDHVSLGKMGFDFGPMRGEERSEKSAKLST